MTAASARVYLAKVFVANPKHCSGRVRLLTSRQLSSRSAYWITELYLAKYKIAHSKLVYRNLLIKCDTRKFFWGDYAPPNPPLFFLTAEANCKKLHPDRRGNQWIINSIIFGGYSSIYFYKNFRGGSAPPEPPLNLSFFFLMMGSSMVGGLTTRRISNKIQIIFPTPYN